MVLAAPPPPRSFPQQVTRLVSFELLPPEPAELDLWLGSLDSRLMGGGLAGAAGRGGGGMNYVGDSLWASASPSSNRRRWLAQSPRLSSGG